MLLFYNTVREINLQWKVKVIDQLLQLYELMLKLRDRSIAQFPLMAVLYFPLERRADDEIWRPRRYIYARLFRIKVVVGALDVSLRKNQ